MADSNSIGKFPAPYIDSVNERESCVVRVDQDRGEIGSRPSGMPSMMMTERMGIQHVGGTTSGSRSNNADNK